MSTLTIVASIRAKVEKVAFVKAELEKLVSPTRAEAGCVQYDLHQDNDDPAHFFFFENWESRERWQDHMESEHISKYRKATETALKLSRCTR